MSHNKYDDNNIFAKIIKKDLDATIIYEDDMMMCFKDIYPIAKVHLLCIPKGRYMNYSDFISNASETEIVHFFKSIQKIASENAIDNSYRLITNCGSKSGQMVFHFHVHIISGQEKAK